MPQIANSQAKREGLRAAIIEVMKWPTAQLSEDNRPGIGGPKLALISALIFLSAVGVRILCWQDRHTEIVAGKTALSGVFNRYEKEAKRMLDPGGLLFPRDPPAAGDARMLVHPPGYSLLLAAVYRLGGDPYKWLWFVQIVFDGGAAVLVFMIAFELINWRAALIAALLAAISPHLAYYSLILSPDSLAVTPLLVGIYCFIRAYKCKKLALVIAAGGLIGLSCWLRANALLLAPFLAVITVILFPSGLRLRYSVALLGAAVIVVSPITIRNLIVFHSFIPVSIAAGENLVVGIGDYDSEGKFGMPRSDRETRMKDAEWNGRPEYAATLWTPDGIERDRVRFARGLKVIRSNPGWFAGVMLRRAGFMLRYNDSVAHRWPFNTAVVSTVSSEPPFSHALLATGETDRPSPPQAVVVLNGSVIRQSLALNPGDSPTWSISAEQLVGTGTPLAVQAGGSATLEGQTLLLSGDDSAYADQFESAPIPVRKDTDYVLAMTVRVVRGDMALKVTNADRRIACAVASIADAEAEATQAGAAGEEGEPSASERMIVIQMPFASARNSELRLVLSNNGVAASRPAARVESAQIFEIGPTASTWTRFPRRIVRVLQRNVFTTSRMLPAVMIGIALLGLAGRWNVLAMLLATPIYYLCAQAALSTEYRYILGIHYFLFVAGGVALQCLGAAVVGLAKNAARRLAMRS